jgi:hypothetical protein
VESGNVNDAFLKVAVEVSNPGFDIPDKALLLHFKIGRPGSDKKTEYKEGTTSCTHYIISGLLISRVKLRLRALGFPSSAVTSVSSGFLGTLNFKI